MSIAATKKMLNCSIFSCLCLFIQVSFQRQLRVDNGAYYNFMVHIDTSVKPDKDKFHSYYDIFTKVRNRITSRFKRI